MDESNVTPHRRRGEVLWGTVRPRVTVPTPYQNLAIAVVQSAYQSRDWKWFLTDWARLLIEGCGVRYPDFMARLRMQRHMPYGQWRV